MRFYILSSDIDGGWGQYEKTSKFDVDGSKCYVYERECNNPVPCGNGSPCIGEKRDNSTSTCQV